MGVEIQELMDIGVDEVCSKLAEGKMFSVVALTPDEA
jgi:hypothetical protein